MDDTKKPARWRAIVALALPVLACPTGAAIAVAVLGAHGVARLAAEAGSATTVIVAAAALHAMPLCGVMAFLSARGRVIPCAVAIAGACLPWACGIAGELWAAGVVERVAGYVAAGDLGSVMARGASEALRAQLLGSWISGWLLAGTAAAFAVGAGGLAGAGRGGDPRGSALGAAAAWTGAIAVAAFSAAWVGAAVSSGLAAVSDVGPASRTAAIARGASELAVLLPATRIGTALALVSAGLVAFRASRRGPPVAAGVVRFVAAAAVGLAAPAAGLVADARTFGLPEIAPPPPWERAPGFSPLALPDSGTRRADPSAWIVTPESVFPGAGDPIPMGDPARADGTRELAAGLARLAAGPEGAGPDTAAAVDGRVSGPAFHALLRALAGAGIGEIGLVGAAEGSLWPREEAGRIPRPFRALAGPEPRRVRVLLESALRGGCAWDERVAFRGEIGDGRGARLEPRPGGETGGPIDLGGAGAGGRRRGSGIACLVLDPGDAPGAAIRTAALAADAGFEPVLALEPFDFPGRPGGPIGLRGIARSGDGRGEEEPAGPGGGAAERPGAAGIGVAIAGLEVKGSLSREVVRRIVKRHLPEVQRCYDAWRADRPGEGGRVSVKLIVAPTGAVEMSATAESTLLAPSVERCASEAAKGWIFPQPEGGGIVVATVAFDMGV